MKNQVLEQIKKLVESAKAQEMESLYIEVEATDAVAVISTAVAEQNPERVYSRINERYRDMVIGFEPVMYHYYGKNRPASFSHFRMVLEEEAQKKFDEEKKNYFKAKADWCSKYGCD